MLRTLHNQNFIRKQRSVYSSDPTLEILNRNSCDLSAICSLQESFSDIDRGIPIPVAYMSTVLTDKSCINTSIVLVDMPTFIAGLGSVFGIDFLNQNLFSDTNAFQSMEKLEIRNSVYNPIAFSSFIQASEVSEFFNADCSFVFFGNSDNLPSHLIASVSNKVILIIADFIEASDCPDASFICFALESSPSVQYLELLDSNIPSKVELFDDFIFFGVIQSHSNEVRRTNINANNVTTLFGNIKIFLKNNLDFVFIISFDKNDAFEVPTFIDKIIEPIEHLVFDNRDNNSFKKLYADNRISPFCIEECKIPCSEFYRNIVESNIKHIIPLSPDFPSDSLGMLGGHTELFANGGVTYAV